MCSKLAEDFPLAFSSKTDSQNLYSLVLSKSIRALCATTATLAAPRDFGKTDLIKDSLTAVFMRGDRVVFGHPPPLKTKND